MERFCIESCGAKCLIDSDQPLRAFFEKNSKLFTIPNLKITMEMSGVNNVFIYRDCLPGEEYIKCKKNLIYVKYPKKELTDFNVAYIARYLIEKQYAEQQKATCHSACMCKDGQAVLLLGDAGAGKTSIAINLWKQYGYDVISNDQTVIGIKEDQLYAYGGTQFINFRYASVEQNMPFLISKLFSTIPRDKWNEKVTVLADQIGMNVVTFKTPIQQILVLHVDNRKEEVVVQEGDNWKNNFMLYQNLTENIRNSASCIVNKYGHPIGYVPSYDNFNLFQKRSNMIQKINQNAYFKTVTGPLDLVLEYIENQRKKITEGKEKTIGGINDRRNDRRNIGGDK